jgi:hypothetical protein
MEVALLGWIKTVFHRAEKGLFVNIIAYLNSTSSIGRKLQRTLNLVLPEEALVTRHTPEELAATLSKSHARPEIVILLAASQKELARVLEMKMLLRDRKIILILPDDSQTSFDRGCTIYPRFTCDINSDFTDVAAVLEKMMSTCSLSESRN